MIRSLSTKYRTHWLSHGGMPLTPTVEKRRFLPRFHSATVSANSFNWQKQIAHYTQRFPFTEITPGDILLSP